MKKILTMALCISVMAASFGMTAFAEESEEADAAAVQEDAQAAETDDAEAAEADDAETADEAAEVSDHEIWTIWENGMAVEAAAADYDFSTSKSDTEDFVPYLIAYTLEDQSTVKGNMIVLSGGGDRTRSDDAEGIPCCEWLNSIGYNAFLLEYRVQPYETADASLDVQRAVRYVKYYAEEKGLGKIENIGMMGFSAGAMHCYSEAIMLSGNITPDSIYPDYVCDDIDAVDASVVVCACIYAAGSSHNTAGEAIDIKEPIMLLDEEDTNYPASYPAFFFAGASGHFASGFCVEAYSALNAYTECELHMYAGINNPFAMGYNYAGSDQMIDQLEAFLDVEFGFRDRSNKEE